MFREAHLSHDGHWILNPFFVGSVCLKIRLSHSPVSRWLSNVVYLGNYKNLRCEPVGTRKHSHTNPWGLLPWPGLKAVTIVSTPRHYQSLTVHKVL